MTRNRCASPEDYHHAPNFESSSDKQHLQEGKKSRLLEPLLVLGFPSTLTGQWMEGSHNALQEGMMSPKGGTVSVSSTSTRISPDSHIHNPTIQSIEAP